VYGVHVVGELACHDALGCRLRRHVERRFVSQHPVMIRAQLNRGAVLPLDNVLESAHSAPKTGHINVGRLGNSRIMPGHRRRRRAVTLGNGTYGRL
jgi:hypothetical protein